MAFYKLEKKHVHVVFFPQKKMEELIASGRYDKRDDFAVILQPYAKNAVPPRLPVKPNLYLQRSASL